MSEPASAFVAPFVGGAPPVDLVGNRSPHGVDRDAGLREGRGAEAEAPREMGLASTGPGGLQHSAGDKAAWTTDRMARFTP